MSLPLLRRKMSFSRLAAFEVATALLFSFFQVALAFVYPTVWALIVGLVFGSFVNVVGSFFLSKHKADDYNRPLNYQGDNIIWQWITALSAIFFVTTNFDRLYLPSVLSLETLGIFAIARTITDVVGNLFVRLNNSIRFPFVASRAKTARQTLKLELRALVVSNFCGCAVLVPLAGAPPTTGVIPIRPALSCRWMDGVVSSSGAWFSILASTAEASLLGLGRPQAATITNGAKLIWLFSALPIGFWSPWHDRCSSRDFGKRLDQIPCRCLGTKTGFIFFPEAGHGGVWGFVFLLLFVALARHNLGLPFLV